jgi:hypothetical protein
VTRRATNRGTRASNGLRARREPLVEPQERALVAALLGDLVEHVRVARVAEPARLGELHGERGLEDRLEPDAAREHRRQLLARQPGALGLVEVDAEPRDREQVVGQHAPGPERVPVEGVLRFDHLRGRDLGEAVDADVDRGHAPHRATDFLTSQRIP